MPKTTIMMMAIVKEMKSHGSNIIEKLKIVCKQFSLGKSYHWSQLNGDAAAKEG